jgi:hypothetical protein
MTAPNEMKLVSLSLCALIGILNLTGCSRKSTPAGPAAPEVLVTTVAPRDVPVIKEGVATLNGSEHVFSGRKSAREQEVADRPLDSAIPVQRELPSGVSR